MTRFIVKDWKIEPIVVYFPDGTTMEVYADPDAKCARVAIHGGHDRHIEISLQTYLRRQGIAYIAVMTQPGGRLP